jgi:hypothetical protein
MLSRRRAVVVRPQLGTVTSDDDEYAPHAVSDDAANDADAACLAIGVMRFAPVATSSAR